VAAVAGGGGGGRGRGFGGRRHARRHPEIVDQTARSNRADRHVGPGSDYHKINDSNRKHHNNPRHDDDAAE